VYFCPAPHGVIAPPQISQRARRQETEMGDVARLGAIRHGLAVLRAVLKIIILRHAAGHIGE
jgi:hypothetical protein